MLKWSVLSRGWCPVLPEAAVPPGQHLGGGVYTFPPGYQWDLEALGAVRVEAVDRLGHHVWNTDEVRCLREAETRTNVGKPNLPLSTYRGARAGS